jgi:NAD(P)-dependent dehydrogenase (short-subunit alcohol dehydrogenase family)
MDSQPLRMALRHRQGHGISHQGILLLSPLLLLLSLQNLKDPAAVDRLLSRTPLGRLAQPQDVSGIVAFLAGPGAAFVTGQTIAVDGGYSVTGFW